MATWIITPYFCKASLIADHIQHIQTHQLLTSNMRLVIVNDHYPIDSHEHALVKVMTKMQGHLWVDPGQNIGMQKAINFALKEIKASNDDIVILSDADDRAGPYGYSAISRVVSHPSIAVAALSFPQMEENRLKLKPFPHDMTVNSMDHMETKVWFHPSVDFWHIAAYRMKWINHIGGFDQIYPYWGGLESYLYPKWCEDKMRMGYTSGYTCSEVRDPKFFDPEYFEYKKDIHINKISLSFAEWLKT